MYKDHYLILDMVIINWSSEIEVPNPNRLWGIAASECDSSRDQ